MDWGWAGTKPREIHVEIGVSAPIGALRSGLAAMLETTHRGSVTELDDPRSWLEPARRGVIVLALDDGFDPSIIVDLRAADPETAVIALVRCDDATSEIRALHAGAAAVETWDVDATTLGLIVDLVAGNQAVVPKSLVPRLAAARQEALVTDDEMQWLASLASGTTVAELAARFAYSEREMYRRLSDMYRRIGARDKVHALLIAVKMGLIDVD